MRRIVFIALVVVATSSTGLAQKKAFTINDLYRIKNISDLAVSSDGRAIVYAVSTTDLPRAKRTSRIWIASADGSNARLLTQDTANQSSPRFSPDGKSIMVIMGDSAGDQNLFVVPAAGGAARQVTHIGSGVSDAVWSPDGTRIVFSSDVYPECGGDDACNRRITEQWQKGPLKAHIADALLFRHWTSWKDGTRTHVLLADVATGSVRDLTPGKIDAPPFQLGGPVQYALSPDGKELAFALNPDSVPASSTNSDIWVLSLIDPSAKPRNITVANKAYDNSPKYSPDGRYIAYRTQLVPAYESDLFRLALYDRTKGTTRVLSESYRDWIDDFDWSADSKSLYFTGPALGETPIRKFDLALGTITTVLTGGTIDQFAVTPDQQRIFYIHRTVGEPAEAFVASLRSGRAQSPTRLTHLNDAFTAEVDIRPAEAMWVEGAGGAKVQYYVVKPHGFDPSKKYPMILNVHGGPQGNFGDAFRGDWQIYPGAGYVVVFSNPHGSTGFGQDFTAQISGDYGGQVFDDLMKVTDAVAKLPYVDSTRMGAMGWSFGGYEMNWFEGHTTRFKAIASMMGLYDLRSFYGATEELWFPRYDLKAEPWETSKYMQWSPSGYVRHFQTPVLIITGEKDFRVPYTQSLEFFTDLQLRGIPSKLIVYSNAGHWPSWYEMALYYTAHLEWFNKWLGGAPPPWTSEAFLRNAVFDQKTGALLQTSVH
ncbi:MAG TPA: S9 family peptidase [Gemmatimonadaceae bacterium]|nr:S9 family peptidase [Gemmatimonadaceae bacterium]